MRFPSKICIQLFYMEASINHLVGCVWCVEWAVGVKWVAMMILVSVMVCQNQGYSSVMLLLIMQT